MPSKEDPSGTKSKGPNVVRWTSRRCLRGSDLGVYRRLDRNNAWRTGQLSASSRWLSESSAWRANGIRREIRSTLLRAAPISCLLFLCRIALRNQPLKAHKERRIRMPMLSVSIQTDIVVSQLAYNLGAHFSHGPSGSVSATAQTQQASTQQAERVAEAEAGEILVANTEWNPDYRATSEDLPIHGSKGAAMAEIQNAHFSMARGAWCHIVNHGWSDMRRLSKDHWNGARCHTAYHRPT
jgi:hypothetical protein